MLSRYEHKRIRITTEDGSVLSGIAEVFPSGYGLHEFGRAEESVRIRNVFVFKSDIRRIEDLSDPAVQDITPRVFDDLMGELLEGPFWIVDILPEQVPADAPGQYFSVERYFLQPERLKVLRCKFAEILLQLNCYYDMAVSFDSCESWDKNPDPETFAEKVLRFSGNEFFRAVFANQRAMIDVEPDDTYMTVYDPDHVFSDKLRKLAAAEGLFMWNPEGSAED